MTMLRLGIWTSLDLSLSSFLSSFFLVLSFCLVPVKPFTQWDLFFLYNTNEKVKISSRKELEGKLSGFFQ